MGTEDPNQQVVVNVGDKRMTAMFSMLELDETLPEAEVTTGSNLEEFAHIELD